MIEEKEITIHSKFTRLNGFYMKRGVGSDEDYQLRHIMENIWSIANSYRLSNEKGLDMTETYYIMDEIGSNVLYNESGNVELVPFIFNKDNQKDGEYISYSLMIIKRDIQNKEMISGDLLKGVGE